MSNVIDTLIYDRTANDVINDTDKAYNCYTDLNRIEQACAYIADRLGVTISTKTWLITDIRTDNEMTRLKGNLNTLRTALSRSSTPAVPSIVNFSSITQANNIERLLWDINDLYDNIVSGKHRLSFRLGNKPFGNRR